MAYCQLEFDCWNGVLCCRSSDYTSTWMRQQQQSPPNWDLLNCGCHQFRVSLIKHCIIVSNYDKFKCMKDRPQFAKFERYGGIALAHLAFIPALHSTLTGSRFPLGSLNSIKNTKWTKSWNLISVNGWSFPRKWHAVRLDILQNLSKLK